MDGRLDVNVALNRPAYQPSTWTEQNIVFHPHYSNDGNNDTNMLNGPCAATNAETNPWWAVDLRAVDLRAALYIEGVKFTNRDVSGIYQSILYSSVNFRKTITISISLLSEIDLLLCRRYLLFC